MPVMAFRQEVRRADIKEKTAEHRKQQTKRVFRDRKERRREHTDDRRRRVGQKPSERSLLRAVVFEYQIHRINAVGEVVHDDRRGHHDPDSNGYFERQRNRGAVEEAVQRETSRAQGSPMTACLRRQASRFFGVCVEGHDAIEKKIGNESQSGDTADEGEIIRTLGKLQRFGEKVEESHADDRAGAESQNEMQAVLEPKGEQAAQQSACKGRCRDEHERHSHALYFLSLLIARNLLSVPLPEAIAIRYENLKYSFNVRILIPLY